MKKEDKVERLKMRKRAREKRQRWRKREKKRRERAAALLAAGELPAMQVINAELALHGGEVAAALVSEAEEKMGELAVPAAVFPLGRLHFGSEVRRRLGIPARQRETGIWAWLKKFCVRGRA